MLPTYTIYQKMVSCLIWEPLSFLKQHVDDQGPSTQQLDAVKTDGNDDSTVSSIILAEPGVNVQAQVEAAIN